MLNEILLWFYSLPIPLILLLVFAGGTFGAVTVTMIVLAFDSSIEGVGHGGGDGLASLSVAGFGPRPAVAPIVADASR
jgi:hypothetical protein